MVRDFRNDRVFWIKSNKTGTYVFWLYQYDDSRQVQVQYTINSADTWEYKTLVIPADPTGVIDNNTGAGLVLRFIMGSGSNFTGGTAPVAWQGLVDANRYVGQTVNLADSTSNYMNLTGFQLEVGKVATPFEHRSYGEELALCERYYQRVPVYHESIIGQCWNTTSARFPVQLPVEMRSDPTITVPGPGTSGYSMKPLTASLSWPGGSGNNAVTTRSPRHFYVTCTGYSGLVAGNASTLYAGSNYIYIKCDAEL